MKKENDYVSQLTATELNIYNADAAQLDILSAKYNGSTEFVASARLFIALDTLHARYNDVFEMLDTDSVNHDVKSDFYDLNFDSFAVSITLGHTSAVMSLSCMDTTDMLYLYLITCKMNNFSNFIDAMCCLNVTAETILEDITNN